MPSNLSLLVAASVLTMGAVCSVEGWRGASPCSFLDWKIKNREDTRPGERPFQVSIQDADRGNGYHYCGGSIYNAYTIITSAWCALVVKSDSLQVVAGEYDLTVYEGTEQIRKVSEVIIHPYFNLDHFEYNMAIIKLATPLIFNDYIQPLAIPPLQDVHASGYCNISGWGFNDDNLSNTLQKISLPILATQDCQDALDSVGMPLSDNIFCAGFRNSQENACIGDDGGPLSCLHNDQLYLAGILSFDLNCNNRNYPGIYSAIEYYIQWIQDNAQ